MVRLVLVPMLRRHCVSFSRRRVRLRGSLESLATVAGTEIVCFAFVFQPMLGIVCFDLHATDRINGVFTLPM
jgi:hypothetical protein